MLDSLKSLALETTKTVVGVASAVGIGITGSAAAVALGLGAHMIAAPDVTGPVAVAAPYAACVAAIVFAWIGRAFMAALEWAIR